MSNPYNDHTHEVEISAEDTSARTAEALEAYDRGSAGLEEARALLLTSANKEEAGPALQELWQATENFIRSVLVFKLASLRLGDADPEAVFWGSEEAGAKSRLGVAEQRLAFVQHVDEALAHALQHVREIAEIQTVVATTRVATHGGGNNGRVN